MIGRVSNWMWLGLVLVPGVVRASWYPRVERGTTVTSCVEFSETLDHSWARLNKTFGVKCEYMNEIRSRVIGFLFHCGPNNAQFFFRTREDCESFKAAVNAGKHADVDQFVPLGVKNRGGWIVAYDGCMEKGATASNIAQLGLQRIADYCLCTSKRLGAYRDDKITAAVVTKAVEACSGTEFTPEFREFMLGGFDRTLTKAKRSNKPRPTSNPMTLVPDAPDTGMTAGSEPSTGAGPKPTRIRKGDSYSAVMEKLRGFAAEKKPYGDYLDATYKAPSLLAYPDASGTCVLTFDKARLWRCVGCNPELFNCAD